MAQVAQVPLVVTKVWMQAVLISGDLCCFFIPENLRAPHQGILTDFL
jgi:hypothetical protein